MIVKDITKIILGTEYLNESLAIQDPTNRLIDKKCSQKISKKFLNECNGAFFCNSIRGIWPIKQIDNIKMRNNSFCKKVLSLIVNL